MRTYTALLAKALQSGRPLFIVYYEEPGARERLIEEVKLLAPPEAAVRQTTSVEEAFTAEPAVLLLTPENERAAVELLEGGRELLRNRTLPVVLFLLRGGEAQRTLAELPALSSWVSGVQIDPERVGGLDVEAERARFQEGAGCTPEEWLADYREGRIPDTLESMLRLHHALVLERSS